VIDYDRDGLLDLVCGTRNGTISYLRNTGTGQTPDFTPVTDTLGGVFQTEGFYQECSVALAPQSENGNGYWLYYGQRNGKVALYEINGLEEAQLINPALPGIDFGERPAIRLADLNNNGALEIWSGNARGGVETLEAQLVNPTHATTAPNPLNIYPNPATQQAWLQLPAQFKGGTLYTYDATGQQIASQYLQKGASQWQLPIKNLSPGLYFYQIKTKGKHYSGRLVVNH
ncbi:MAG: T9SS type A sorting domain-containing protein, partial [Bacteroidetes bacterium]|nr:T9SS type A sorting domain-containing protein [Bacteroidota bacterium]